MFFENTEQQCSQGAQTPLPEPTVNATQVIYLNPSVSRKSFDSATGKMMYKRIQTHMDFTN